MNKREAFDFRIGRLDRSLSEVLELAETPDLDEPDRQTLKHHAEDLHGVADKILKLVK